MEDDQFAAAERILLDIESVFKKDPKLKEFDFIPVTINQNKSPVIHVDHCLGLESWCVRHVYCYVYHHIFDSRRSGMRHRRADPAVMSRWLLGALLINPDVTTFWNMRRELLKAGRLDVRAELHLTAVILFRKPKSGEAFSYRKTLLKKFLLQNGIDKDLVLDQEIAICQDSASRYPTNYHAWSHRTWCITEIVPQTSSPFKTILNEWALSEEWIKSHVSDHSGLQYRQFLQKQLFKFVIPSINSSLASTVQGRNLLEKSLCSLTRYISLDETIYEPSSSVSVAPHLEEYLNHNKKNSVSSNVGVLGFIAYELLLNADLILRFSGHEALWCHRRFLMFTLLQTLALQSCDFDYSATSSSVGSKKPWCENLQQFAHDQRNQVDKFRPSCIGNKRVDSHMGKDGIPLEKDQKLSNLIDLDIEEICMLFSEASTWHESQLVQKCTGSNYQHTLASKYRNWLSHILRIDLPDRSANKAPV